MELHLAPVLTCILLLDRLHTGDTHTAHQNLSRQPQLELEDHNLSEWTRTSALGPAEFHRPAAEAGQ